MEFPITRANPQDGPNILALQKLAYQSEAALCGDWTIPPLTQTEAQIEAEFQSRVFLKAVDGNRIVGSVRAFSDRNTCYIGRLIVHPDFQRKGIGTRLILEIENLFSGAERFEMFTGSKSITNIRLYQRLGYRVYREEDLTQKVRIVFMEKRP